MDNLAHAYTGFVETAAGPVPILTTQLCWRDYVGTLQVRWGIHRDRYQVNPGIYAVGIPGSADPVWVTGNYKLSVDHLRKNLDGLHAWILVLDTKGINVWCAAGKGTFGTRELARRIDSVQLRDIVMHRRLILPQLGATGVSAHELLQITKPETENKKLDNTSASFKAGLLLSSSGTENSKSALKPDKGFSITWGPVRAEDIQAFVAAGYKCTESMRTVRFDFTDRLKLIPVELQQGKLYLLTGIVLIVILSGLTPHGYSLSSLIHSGIPASLKILCAYLSGVLLTPLLLPWIPGRMFALKGAISGMILGLIILAGSIGNEIWSESIAWLMILPSLSSFMAMNFTGSSTFTSLSGVKKEMKRAMPLQVIFALCGLILFSVSRIIH